MISLKRIGPPFRKPQDSDCFNYIMFSPVLSPFSFIPARIPTEIKKKAATAGSLPIGKTDFLLCLLTPSYSCSIESTRPWTVSLLGSLTVTTPFLKEAFALFGSTSTGRLTL